MKNDEVHEVAKEEWAYKVTPQLTERAQQAYYVLQVIIEVLVDTNNVVFQRTFQVLLVVLVHNLDVDKK